MIKHSISYEDLTGGLNNVDTINRINSSTRRTESPDIMNIEYFSECIPTNVYPKVD